MKDQRKLSQVGSMDIESQQSLEETSNSADAWISNSEHQHRRIGHLKSSDYNIDLMDVQYFVRVSGSDLQFAYTGGGG
jgi:hypothetical protein